MSSVFRILLTIQIMCVLLMFFFGWLGTKMELPDAASDWWFYLSLVPFVIMVLLGIFVPNKYLKS